MFRILLLSLIGFSLAGCGFHLRSSGPTLSGDLRVEGPGGDDAFVKEFRRSVAAVNPPKTGSANDVAVVVHIYQLFQRRRPLTLGRFGRANEFDLIYRLVYDIRSPKGEIISPRQEIELHRDYYNDQSQPIAQDEEEGMIRAEMQKEIAQTLLRRVIYALEGKSEPKS